MYWCWHKSKNTEKTSTRFLKKVHFIDVAILREYLEVELELMIR